MVKYDLVPGNYCWEEMLYFLGIFIDEYSEINVYMFVRRIVEIFILELLSDWISLLEKCILIRFRGVVLK